MNSIACVLTLLSITVLANPVMCQEPEASDPVLASPHQFRVLLDNEHVRVVEYTLSPGERDRWHTHPPKVSYVVSGGELRIHMADGTSFPATERAGSASWMDALPRHYAENVGTTAVRIVLTEVKAARKQSDPEHMHTSMSSSAVIDTLSVMKPVHEFVASFNKGDATTSDAGCAHVTSIVDDFPPHEWYGADACRMWMQSYRDYTTAHGLADMIITLGDPRHVDVSGDRAYVVVPASYTIEVHGKLVHKTNSIVTFALQKGAATWHLTGWAWADG